MLKLSLLQQTALVLLIQVPANKTRLFLKPQSKLGAKTPPPPANSSGPADPSSCEQNSTEHRLRVQVS